MAAIVVWFKKIKNTIYIENDARKTIASFGNKNRQSHDAEGVARFRLNVSLGLIERNYRLYVQ